MHSRPLFGLISLFSIVSALDSDPSWFLDGDFSSDTDLALSPGVLSAALPSDLDFGVDSTTPPVDSYSSDISSNNDLPWDTNLDSNNVLNFDDPLLIADCSSSENIPSIGTSRLRRRDGSASCVNNGVNKGTSGEINLPTVLFSSDALDALETKIMSTNREQNGNCLLYSQQVLPVGVCSSGRIQDISVTGAITIGGVQFAALSIRNPILGTSAIESFFLSSLFFFPPLSHA